MSTELLPFFTPESIEAESFAIIDREAGLNRLFQGRAWDIARRLVHTTADFDILSSLRLSEAAIDAGVNALLNGAPIFTDTEMARCGMTRRHLGPLGVQAHCLLDLPGVAERAAAQGGTRSWAAMELAREQLKGAIVAIGNAPTALLALMEHLDTGGPAPALVIAMPVGFVNAAESKELFARRSAEQGGPACITIMGRKGGSTLAAATVNALARLASERAAELAAKQAAERAS